jgi:hypothetical protein
MSKPPADPFVGLGAPPRYYVRVQREARPPAPWTWVLYKEGSTELHLRSARHYRCAEDALAVGRAVLDRLEAMRIPCHAGVSSAGALLYQNRSNRARLRPPGDASQR